MANLIISLDEGEHARRLPQSERFQVEGEAELRRHLGDSLKRAEKTRDGDKNMVSERVHDAIFIDGTRGSGKTNFMLNMAQAAENLKGLHFCAPIDPTLLDGRESFLNVVIAKLHDEVKTKQKERDQNYYRAFEAVAQALESQEENAEAGMSRILNHRHSLGLITALDEYYQSVCKALDCKLVIIPIDDIDMAFTKAYEILDVIRRYLASPLVVPVVSGDLALYTHILRSRFHRDLNRGIPDNSHADNTDLAEKYLEKVLPKQRRIRVKNVPEVMALHTITVKTAQKEADLRRVMEFLKHTVFRLTNGEEDSHPNLLPESARSLLQLLGRLAPTIGAVDWTKIANENDARTQALKQAEDSKAYRETLTALAAHWQDEKRLILEADLALIAIEDDAKTKSENTEQDKEKAEDKGEQPLIRPLVELPLFNVNKQNSLPYAEISWVYRWGDGRVRQGIERKTVVPMPELEPASIDIIFTKTAMRAHQSSTHGLAGRILSHNNYFSPHKKAYLIFFGRLFEIIVNSFFYEPTKSHIQILLANAPLHSHFSIPGLKDFGGNDKWEDSDTEIVTSPAEDELIDNFVAAIKTWRNRYVKAKPSAQLLYKAMNKAFTQFALLRQERRLHGESIEQLMERAFRIITNAFASFEKNTLLEGQTIVARQETGLGEHINPLNLDKDNCYNINVKPAERQPDSVTAAVVAHPVFTLIDRNASSKLAVGAIASRPTGRPGTSMPKTGTNISVANTYLKSRSQVINDALSDAPPADAVLAIAKTIGELQNMVPDLSEQLFVWKKLPNGYQALLDAAEKLGIEHNLPRKS